MVSAKYPTLLTPDGYAFSIWGVIFLGLSVYAIWQLLPAQAGIAALDRVARTLTLVSVATSMWVVAFSAQRILLSVGIMLLLLFGLIITYGQIRRAALDRAVPGWVSVPFALYLSWVSVAAALNVAIALEASGLQSGAVILTYIVLGLLTVITLVVAIGFQDLLYPAAVIWAMAGIWVARVRDEPDLAWVVLGGAVLLALLTFGLVRQRAKRQPWEISTEAAQAETERLRANA